MSSRRIAVAAWTSIAALLGVLACEPEEAPRRMYVEDFETVCDGAPCGWSRTMGSADQATWVETIHPGEHGLRLTGDVTVRGPEAGEDARRLRGDSVTLHVANRCDVGNTLDAVVVLEDDSGTLHDGVARILTSPDWTNRGVRTVFDSGTIVGGRVVSVILEKGGPGSCEVGDITVDITPICTEGCC